MSVGFADLARQTVHVRKETRIEQNRWINFTSFRVGSRVVEQVGQTVEEMSENFD